MNRLLLVSLIIFVLSPLTVLAEEIPKYENRIGYVETDIDNPEQLAVYVASDNNWSYIVIDGKFYQRYTIPKNQRGSFTEHSIVSCKMKTKGTLIKSDDIVKKIKTTKNTAKRKAIETELSGEIEFQIARKPLHEGEE